MLELELLFTGLGITKRDDVYVCRSLKSFGSLLDTIAHKPITLEHPSIDNEKSLLLHNSSYQIIGSIKEVSEATYDYIKVYAVITDPKFISFYNSLSDEEKSALQISPAVVSHYGPSYELGGFTIVEEIIDSIDHHAVLCLNDGYWMNYVDVQPVMDLKDDKQQHIINNDLNGEKSMADFETLSTGEEVELKDIQENELVESKECNVDEDKKELITEEAPVADKPEEEVKDSKEELEAVAEEVVPVSETSKEDSEEAPVEAKEDVEELTSSEDEIVEEYETPEDIEREVAVKLVQNLIDSVDGFRKPYFKGRVKPETYIRKALSLNKEFIDAKYHSSIDSISAELGKELLSGIKSKDASTQSKSSSFNGRLISF